MNRTKLIIVIIVSICSLLALLCLLYFYSRSWEFSFFITPLSKIRTGRKIIALTFDDGPSASRTPALLSLLEKHGVRATFFMTGMNIEKHPDIAEQVYKAGHLIGNHSYSHPRMMLKSYRFVFEEINKTDALVASTGQTRVDYFRTPYNKKLFMLPYILKSMNKHFVTCTYDPPSEYRIPFDSDKIADEIVQHTEPGSIIILHDGNNSNAVEFVEAVELVIIRLKAEGYEFVRLDGDLQDGQSQ